VVLDVFEFSFEVTHGVRRFLRGIRTFFVRHLFPLPSLESTKREKMLSLGICAVQEILKGDKYDDT
jgi:hypothetical protein